MDAGQRPPGPDLRALAFFFTAGVLGVHALRELPPTPILMAATLPLLLPWGRARGWRPHYAMLLLGVLLTTWQAQRQLALRWPETRHNEEVLVRGHIASLPELKTLSDRKGEAVRTARFLFRPADAALPLTRASWYKLDEFPRGGECWELRLRLKTPHGSMNPGAFDYEAWLFRQGIGATASVKGGERCADAGGSAVLHLRQRIAGQLHEWLPQHAAAPMVAALLVGDDSALTDADWEVFRLTGTSHLIVISGFNLGIVAGTAFFLLRWLWSAWPPLCLRWPAQKAGLLGSAIAAAAYALLAGFEPPVLRALLMLLFILGVLGLHRVSQPSRVLALAWLVILLFDPFALMSPGLWLSFGAVAAIFYISMQRLAAPGWVRGFVQLQLMLSLLLAPLSLYFFNGLSWAGPFINLLAVPLFALLTPAVLLAALLAAVCPAAGLPVLEGVADALGVFREALASVTAQPGLWWPGSAPAGALALALLGAVLLFLPRGLPLRLPGLLCLLPLLWPPVQAPREGIELTVLDVGQGLAVVVRTPNHALLYDAGPAFEEGFDAGESIVAPFLLSRGVRELDLMLLSHPHQDHTGGAQAVRERLRVLEELSEESGQSCRDGRRWQWDGVDFQLLHPDAARWAVNNQSCVLRVEYRGQVLLLPGDIEKAAESRLVREHAPLLRADVLVAAHHGSKTSSTEKFVQAAQPALVIHSAGWRHHFRHPHPSVVARYAAAGAQQAHTGGQGALSLVLDGSGRPALREERRDAAHWWNAPPESLPEAHPPSR